MRTYGTKIHVCRTATQKAFQACTDLLTKTPQVQHSQQDASIVTRTSVTRNICQHGKKASHFMKEQYTPL